MCLIHLIIRLQRQRALLRRLGQVLTHIALQEGAGRKLHVATRQRGQVGGGVDQRDGAARVVDVLARVEKRGIHCLHPVAA